jgi:hypothetical protein
MPKTERVVLQEKIRGEFADRVKANQERLCQSCVSWFGRCEHNLLPVTSKGQDCPYYRRKED